MKTATKNRKNGSGKLDQADDHVELQIKAPNFKTGRWGLIGTAPYVQLRFSEKQKETMLDKMSDAQPRKKGKERPPRDYNAEYEAATYRFPDNTYGINAASFRNAMIRACSAVNLKMTETKMNVFVEADGFDKYDGTPLVRIKGTPEKYVAMVRNADGSADIRVRAMWREWEVDLTVKWDADQFTVQDISNLLVHAGIRVGIGEGRPMSKKSAGMGFGTFTLKAT